MNINISKGKATSSIQGNSHKATSWLFSRNPAGQKRVAGFKVMREKNLQPRILCLATFSFWFDGEIKSFTDKLKLKEFSTTKPALKEMLRNFSKWKRKGHNKKYENYERKKSHWQRQIYNKGSKSTTQNASRKVKRQK